MKCSIAFVHRPESTSDFSYAVLLVRHTLATQIHVHGAERAFEKLTHQVPRWSQRYQQALLRLAMDGAS